MFCNSEWSASSSSVSSRHLWSHVSFHFTWFRIRRPRGGGTASTWSTAAAASLVMLSYSLKSRLFYRTAAAGHVLAVDWSSVWSGTWPLQVTSSLTDHCDISCAFKLYLPSTFEGTSNQLTLHSPVLFAGLVCSVWKELCCFSNFYLYIWWNFE